MINKARNLFIRFNVGLKTNKITLLYRYMNKQKIKMIIMTNKQTKAKDEQSVEQTKKAFIKLSADMVIKPVSIKFGESKYGQYVILNERDKSYITSAKNVLNFFSENKFVPNTTYNVLSIGTYKEHDVITLVKFSQSKTGDY